MTMPPLILGVGALALVWNVVMMGCEALGRLAVRAELTWPLQCSAALMLVTRTHTEATHILLVTRTGTRLLCILTAIARQLLR